MTKEFSKHIQGVLEDMRQGKGILLVDHSNREDEVDFCIALEKATEENIAFSIREVKGLMCCTLTSDRVKKLGIPPVPTNNKDALQTPFQSAVDAAAGVTTGMSVKDRLRTFEVLLSENSKPDDLSYPGHMQILKVRDGLLDERQGHSEMSITLAVLADMQPACMIQELINPDGTMTKGDDIKKFAKKHKLKVVSVQEVKEAFDLYNSK